jgi:pyridoxine 5-phosphate synthase
MYPRLGVNIDHVATLRQVRKVVPYPDPVYAAYIASEAGADQITVHLREDRRHIQDRDVKILKETVPVRLNLEMANAQEMVKIALYLKPFSVTLVPEKREEITTEGGLDVLQHQSSLQRTVAMLTEAGIRACLFIDPDLDQVKASHKISADAIEIHTGRYCEAKNAKEEDQEFQAILNATKSGKKLGMGVHAGHGLNYHNIKRLLQVDEIEEYNIGHAIIARAVFSGLEQAVAEMVNIIRHKG